MNIPDSEGDFSPEFLLVKLHPNNFVGEPFIKKLNKINKTNAKNNEPFVEESVDLSATAEFQSVDGCRAASLDGSFEILL